jgi:hypothetical protein
LTKKASAPDLSGVTSFAELSERLGVSAKKLRAIHRKNVRANGGVIGKDTPGRGKTYSRNDFAKIAESVLATMNDESESAE